MRTLRWSLPIMLLAGTHVLMIRHMSPPIALAYMVSSSFCVLGVLFAVELLLRVRKELEVIDKNVKMINENLLGIARNLEEQIKRVDKRISITRANRG